MSPIPITILTGFLGAGKTTLILNLLPQLPKTYKLALLKNEFGDLAVDSQLASANAISGVRELLNGCICCSLVGQLSDALLQLRDEVKPDRIIIETSGSAFPATLAMEVNRLGHEKATAGMFVLDGVVSVIDVENWKGYEDTSYTAKMQARYTDLVVFNKSELVDERRFDECLDRHGDLDLEVPVPWVKSVKGRVDKDVILGVDGAMIAKEGMRNAILGNVNLNGAEHEHSHDHQDEVEVLTITLHKSEQCATVDLDAFEELLLSAKKDEIYRIKGLITTSKAPEESMGERRTSTLSNRLLYVLNWAFGRWTYTALAASEMTPMDDFAARLIMIVSRGEASRWKKKIEDQDLIVLEHKPRQSTLRIAKIG